MYRSWCPRGLRVFCPRDCYDTCALIVEAANGRIVRVRGDPDHPVTRGATCPRAYGDPLRNRRGRILHPYVRVGGKPDGRLARLGLEEALDLLAERIKHVLDEYGPESIIHIDYAGNMGLLSWYYPRRLWNTLGAASTDYSLCSATGHEAIGLHYGLSYGTDPSRIPDMKMIVFWGVNAAVSAMHLWLLAREAKKKGALLATIDPRITETARASDLHLRPRPGTDVALAYGIANLLIQQGLVDTGFIERYTYGFHEYAREASKWTPERVERVTGVPKRLLTRFAEEYGSRKPSLIFIGMGVTRTPNGPEIARAASLLPALVGQHRGFYYTNSRGWLLDPRRLTGEAEGKKPSRIVPMAELGPRLARGEFKLVFIHGVNAVESLPASSLVAKGLSRRDVYVVVHDTHWNTTTRYADLVLPAPTYLEKPDTPLTYSHPLVGVNQPAARPPGEAISEARLAQELAKRLGINEDWVHEDPLEALRKLLAETATPLPGGLYRLHARRPDEYQTPTGRIEFYSTKARKHGLNPLPQHHDTTLREDEYLLLTGAHPKYTNSQFREVYGPHPPVVHINPHDARALGIGEAQPIIVYNSQGQLLLKAHITDTVPPRTLWAARHTIDLKGRPLNTIVPPTRHRLGGTPVLNAVRVRLRKPERQPTEGHSSETEIKAH